jgi:regulatory protein
MAKSVREAAMDYLSRREHTTYELAQKLINKEYDVGEVHAALEKLNAEGLLSDKRFVEAFVFHRMQRGSGPYKIQAELRHKGVNDALIADFLDERDSDWFTIAQEVREKKFGPLPPTDLKEKARQARFLQQRGFSHEQTRRALHDDEL